MEAAKHIELTKNGKAFILFGSLFIILGLAIENYLLVVPGFIFWIVVTSTFISYFQHQNLNLDLKLRVSKTYMRSRGLLAVVTEINNSSSKVVRFKIALGISFHFRSIKTPETVYVKLQPNETKKLVWLLLAVRRGNATIGPAEISVGPFQNLFENKRILKEKISIKVLPQRPRVNIPWKTKKELLLKMVHEFAQRVKGRGDEFFALRDYLPGDEVKHIDWYATARHDRLITKEFEDERNLHFLVYLDLGGTMFGPKFEYALSSAVELSSLIRGTNHDLGVIAYSDIVKRFIVPQLGKKELSLMLNLYDLEATGVQSNFINAVKFTKNNKLLHSIAIIFSDLEGDLRKKMQGLHLLRTMGSRVIFVNYSTLDFNILASPGWLLSRSQDMDYSLVIERVFPSLVKDEYKRREKELRNILYSVGGDYIEINGYEDNIILSLYRLMRKYSPTQRLVQEALERWK
ncbi:MAG: DUF58 domain-containing protein [Candidatus Heimdallarchaeota archaeon]|nr:DUF58 domain-containing protein [Candidatus Heimdallarchaeota archaeon]MCK4877628.1 DUF58 domain-containing protein [Candidatus Heimdallarchaeota archaeon]